MILELETALHADTVRLGRLLGRALAPGMLVALVGDLGAGKTTLVKGVAAGLLQLDEREVTSPTFTILQEYGGAVPLYHFDAYRLDGADDLAAVGFEDYVDGNGVTVIEWADRIESALPEERLMIYIDQPDDTLRRFRLMTESETYAALLRQLAADYAGC